MRVAHLPTDHGRSRQIRADHGRSRARSRTLWQGCRATVDCIEILRLTRRKVRDEQTAPESDSISQVASSPTAAVIHRWCTIFRANLCLNRKPAHASTAVFSFTTLLSHNARLHAQRVTGVRR
eukprot:68223-Pleurochrysis_carterae.AAC.2